MSDMMDLLRSENERLRGDLNVARADLAVANSLKDKALDANTQLYEAAREANQRALDAEAREREATELLVKSLTALKNAREELKDLASLIDEDPYPYENGDMNKVIVDIDAFLKGDGDE